MDPHGLGENFQHRQKARCDLMDPAHGIGEDLRSLTVRAQSSADPHNLIRRFILMHREHYPRALREITAGEKQSHWSWFIWPVPPFIVNGVERGSEINKRFCLRTDDEARAYLQFPTHQEVNLRQNYIEIVEEMTRQVEKGVRFHTLVGPADDPKCRSSLRLFERISRSLGDAEVQSVCQYLMELIHETPTEPFPNPRTIFA
mmetsp:Transcript_4489/g.9783  ORF Transcript_4489/g.9783 Transcript_4489/m.9783 type:complete len:202 (+) Transcript_4489:50-655(+)